MTTTDPTTDPEKTTGGTGTDGHYEGNGTSTTTQSTDGQPEGNGPQS